MAGDDGQAVLPEFVKDLLAAEAKRGESLEARGAAVITLSGTLVTLLLALAALATGRAGFMLRGWSAGLLTAAVVTFAVAALLAIATYAPQRTTATDPNDIRRMLPTLWDKGDEFALKKTTVTRLAQLSTSQRVNDIKALILLAAVVTQVIAVILLAAAAVTML